MIPGGAPPTNVGDTHQTYGKMTPGGAPPTTVGDTQQTYDKKIPLFVF